jgi:acetyl esterase/lipase
VPLDPHARRLLDMLAAGRLGPPGRLTPTEMREGFARLTQVAGVRGEPIAAVEDAALPGPGGPLPIRIYRPTAPTSAGLLYFHGGGGIFGSIDTHDGLARMLANASGCCVISVEYRLAPEHGFPAGVEDACAALDWLMRHASDLGIDRDRIAVGGDSAGGNIAAVVCQLARERAGPRVALQVLLCPVTDMADESGSRRSLAEGFFLDKPTIDWILENYCPAPLDRADPRISPLRAADLSGLPPAHIHTAEFDPLRDEGAAYAARLQGAGVPVSYTCHPGMLHHFYGLAGAIPYGREAIKSAGRAIGEALACK